MLQAMVSIAEHVTAEFSDKKITPDSKGGSN